MPKYKDIQFKKEKYMEILVTIETCFLRQSLLDWKFYMEPRSNMELFNSSAPGLYVLTRRAYIHVTVYRSIYIVIIISLPDTV